MLGREWFVVPAASRMHASYMSGRSPKVSLDSLSINERSSTPTVQFADNITPNNELMDYGLLQTDQVEGEIRFSRRGSYEASYLGIRRFSIRDFEVVRNDRFEAVYVPAESSFALYEDRLTEDTFDVLSTQHYTAQYLPGEKIYEPVGERSTSFVTEDETYTEFLGSKTFDSTNQTGVVPADEQSRNRFTTVELQTEEVLSENAEARSFYKIRHRFSPRDDIYTAETFEILTSELTEMNLGASSTRSLFQTLRSQTPYLGALPSDQSYDAPITRSITPSAPTESIFQVDFSSRETDLEQELPLYEPVPSRLHRVGPKDDWFQMETITEHRRISIVTGKSLPPNKPFIPKCPPHFQQTTSFADQTPRPFDAEEQQIADINTGIPVVKIAVDHVRRGSQAVTEIIIEDYSPSEIIPKILHRAGPKDFNFETYYAVVSQEDADRMLRTASPSLSSTAILAEFR